MNEMKEMVTDLTKEVKYEQGNMITIQAEASKASAAEKSKTTTTPENTTTKTETVTEKKKDAKHEAPITCPKCNTGTIIKGKSAYGCSAFKDGCNFKIDFEFGGKKLSEKQLFTLIQKKKSPSIKGFTINNQKVNGHLILNTNFATEFVEEQEKIKAPITIAENQTCPKCKQGLIIKGKTAFGCNRFREGCDFRVAFS
jgi:DNA topoisomerase-3